VDKLIIVDIAPKTYEGNHEGIIDALTGLELDNLSNRNEAEFYLRRHINEESTVQFLLKNLSREKEGGYRWKMNLPVITDHYREILSHDESNDIFTGPTLFVRGDKSNYIIPEEFPKFKQNFPNATLDTVPNAGHWVHAENPSKFLEIVSTFLKLN
jgi:esterase